MIHRLIKINNQGRFNKNNLKEILNNVALTSDIGTTDSSMHFQISDMMDMHSQLNIFAIPTYEWLEQLSYYIKNKRVLEIGAGTGIISAILRTFNIDITPIDNFARAINPLIDVVYADGIEYIERHQNEYDVLLGCWPEMDNTFKAACDAFGEKEIYYVGEWEGGCTADDEFFIDYDCINVPGINYPQFFGMHDDVFRVVKK